MHILLIDDSSSTRSLLRTLINSGQTTPHQISEASSGEEALEKVASKAIETPDLVIADINMGGMNGYDLCREYRRRFGGVSDVVPYIITVTANEGVEVINKVLDSGANDYMPKPVNVKVLQVRLRVAERLLAQASPSVNGNGGGDPRMAFIASAIDQADAPIAVVDVSGDVPSYRFVYMNASMVSITQYTKEQLTGKSLAELEAWTPEFLQMVGGAVAGAEPLSHVPLWSRIKQENTVYISLYPVRRENEPVTQYLVIHHL